MKKKNNRTWLDGKSFHIMRDEMLSSYAWKAATHLQRSMVTVLLTELGRHGGRNNGKLIFTDRDFKAWGFAFGSVKPNLAAIEALGLYDFKRGRPGLRGYGNARRGRITFLPILGDDGKTEVSPPTDEWARFSTTKEAKMAAKSAYKKAKGSKMRSRKWSTRLVLQKPEHLTAKRNRKSNAETPVNIGFAKSENGALSRSEEANHTLPEGDVRRMEQQGQVPLGMQQFSCVGTGKYTLSKDPAAMQEYSCVSRHVRFPLLRLVAKAQ